MIEVEKKFQLKGDEEDKLRGFSKTVLQMYIMMMKTIN
jgi:hypothetical protein